MSQKMDDNRQQESQKLCSSPKNSPPNTSIAAKKSRVRADRSESTALFAIVLKPWHVRFQFFTATVHVEEFHAGSGIATGLHPTL